MTQLVTLKKKGYRIVATSPHQEGTTPETFDLEKGKAVLMFGTELNGLTDRPLSWLMNISGFPWWDLQKVIIFLFLQPLLYMN